MTKHYQMLTLRLMPVLVFLFLQACASAPPESPPPKPPTQVNLTIIPETNLNPDLAGKPAPVLLRVYELREQSNFLGADFFALFDNEKAVLAGDLVRKQEFILKPGEEKTLLIEAGEESRFIGLFAAFRQLDNAQWRVIAPISAHQTSAIQLKLENNQLLILPGSNP